MNRNFQRRGPGGPGGFNKSEQMRFQQYAGPTHELPEKSEEDKKFTGRCRLFVGNVSHEITEEEFRKLFEPFGEVSEVYVNGAKGFGFIKMDTRLNAENARSSLDCTVLKGHTIRVRFASHGASLRVKNLSHMVSNELLEYAFSMFGELERAVVIVDERGRPTGEGIVEFARKNKATLALKRCQEECFLLTNSPRPVIVEPQEQRDEDDGLPDKVLPRNSQQFFKERDAGPRFAMMNSFEHEFAERWKQLYELEKQKREALEREIREDRERLEEQMEFSIYEAETNILREKLRQREEDANALIREREMRMREQERIRDEQRRQQEEILRRRQELITSGIGRQGGDDMRRRQEDTLMMQASHLSTLLDQQEAAMRNMQGGNNVLGAGRDPTNGNAPGFDGPGKPGNVGGPGGAQMRQSRFDQPNQGPMGPGGPNMPAGAGAMNRGGGGGGAMGGPGGPAGQMGPAGPNDRGLMGRGRDMEFREEFPGGDMKRRRF